jgi:hypothetical protein
METNDLIKAIASDRTAAPTLRRVWQVASGVAIIAAALVFAISLTPRADIWSVAGSARFLFKFLFSASLAQTTLQMLPALSRPDGNTGLLRLLIAPALLVIAVVIELAVTAPSEWATRMMGRNSGYCLLFIPLIGLLPLATFLAALHYGASTRPQLTGAVGGLAAGGIAAFFYATHCTDDSPLFVATWYTTAIAALALVGALAGPRVARW